MARMILFSNPNPSPIKTSHQHHLLRRTPTKIPNLPFRSASFGNRCVGSNLSPPPPPPPPQINRGTIGLSVADRYGTTIATDTHNPAAKWRTIGVNLIAYGDGDGPCLQLYFDQLLHKFPDNDAVSFQDIMSFNKYGMPSTEWTHHGSLTINVRNRFNTMSIPHNLLSVEISKDHIKQEVTTESLAAIGTGAPFALDVLKQFWSMIDCHQFGASENLRRNFLSIAILEAMRSDDTNSGLFSEIIRGSPFEGWKLVSTTPIDELINKFGSPPDTYLFNHPLPPPPPPTNVDKSSPANIERLRTILKSFEDWPPNKDSLKIWRCPN